MALTKVEQNTKHYANEHNKYINNMLSKAYLAGYSKALYDIIEVIGETATNDVSVLIGKILTFNEEQKSNS